MSVESRRCDPYITCWGLSCLLGVASLLAWKGYVISTPVKLKLVADEVFQCYCTASANLLSKENCQGSLDRLYGGQGLTPYNTTLFCGSGGSLSTQQFNIGWDIATKVDLCYIPPFIITIFLVASGILYLCCTYTCKRARRDEDEERLIVNSSQKNIPISVKVEEEDNQLLEESLETSNLT